MSHPRTWIFAAVAALPQDGPPATRPLTPAFASTSRPSSLPADVVRFELRLREQDFFGAARAQSTDPQEGRRRALAALRDAGTPLPAADQGAAARGFDHARRALRPEPTTEAERWADSLAVSPERRLIDAQQPTLRLRVDQLYPVAVAIPTGATAASMCFNLGVRGCLTDMQSGGGGGPIAALPPWLEIAVPEDADFSVHLWFSAPDHGMLDRGRWRSFWVSSAPNLAARLAALHAGEAALPEAAAALDRTTLRGHLDTLERLAAGATLPTDVRARELLLQAEAILAALRGGQRFFTAARACADLEPDDCFALRVPLPGVAPVLVVVHVPGPARDRRPLVVALDGADDDARRWCLRNLCQRRGWLLATGRDLRAEDLLGLIQALDDVWPVDRGRVVLVGDGPGAAAAVRAASASPDRFRGVAALDGGAAMPSTKGIERLAWLVAASGEEHRGRTDARALSHALTAAQVPQVEWHELAGAGPRTLVPLALPEVSAFLERCLAPVPAAK